MPIHFKCAQCSEVVSLPLQSAGRRANCPKCRKMVDVPAESTAAAPASASSQATGNTSQGGSISPTVMTLILLVGGLAVLIPLSMIIGKGTDGDKVQFVFIGLGIIAIIDQGIRKSRTK
jgi:hypothetical protein